MRLQLTLALIKPDISANPLKVQLIRRTLITNGFLIVKTKKLLLSIEQAEKFYGVHKGKFFYDRLVTFMSSGFTYSHILAREDAIITWRNLMGPTKVFRAIYDAPNTIRGSLGLTDTRNSTHGSDSPASVEEEIDFFFPEFDTVKWFQKEELKFRKNYVKFDQINFVHRPVTLHNQLFRNYPNNV